MDVIAKRMTPADVVKVEQLVRECVVAITKVADDAI